MMNDDVSLISMHPFFQGFVYSAIMSIKGKDYPKMDREIIDADLVPGVSESVMLASMGKEIHNIRDNSENASSERATPIIRRDMSELASPIQKPIIEKKEVKPLATEDKVFRQSIDVRKVNPSPRKIVHSVLVQNEVKPRPISVIVPKKNSYQEVPASTTGNSGDISDYGKVAPLLEDPSISTIECLGKGKELMVVRAGQRQKTRIVLSDKDISNFLGKVAENSHIPLIEGVFRVSVKGFSVNAVISEMVGSRFVIKKNTAYGLLE